MGKFPSLDKSTKNQIAIDGSEILTRNFSPCTVKWHEQVVSDSISVPEEPFFVPSHKLLIVTIKMQIYGKHSKVTFNFDIKISKRLK